MREAYLENREYDSRKGVHHNKFYEIKENANGSIDVRYGCIGSLGQTHHYTPHEANYDSLVQQKLRKGYRVLSSGTTTVNTPSVSANKIPFFGGNALIELENRINTDSFRKKMRYWRRNFGGDNWSMFVVALCEYSVEMYTEEFTEKEFNELIDGLPLGTKERDKIREERVVIEERVLENHFAKSGWVSYMSERLPSDIGCKGFLYINEEDIECLKYIWRFNPEWVKVVLANAHPLRSQVQIEAMTSSWV